MDTLRFNNKGLLANTLPNIHQHCTYLVIQHLIPFYLSGLHATPVAHSLYDFFIVPASSPHNFLKEESIFYFCTSSA